MNLTYTEARDIFTGRTALSARTKDIYACATGHFIDYARAQGLPQFHALGGREEDAGALEQFALWLLNDCEAVTRASTARTYAAGVARWLRWLADHGHLPPTFPLDKARRLLREALRSSVFHAGRRPPEPPGGIGELIVYYDRLSIPGRLKNPAARTRWAVARCGACRSWARGGTSTTCGF